MKSLRIQLIGIVIWLTAISIGYSMPPTGGTTLSGRITDKTTHEPIIGAGVYLPDLQRGTVTDTNGYYRMENLPSTIILVQVTFVGYTLVAEKVDLSTTTNKDFELEESITELHEVVVTGLAKAAQKNRTPTPISTISNLHLIQVISSNIVDAIATQPGISQVTTGPGISKPVIRGLGYNRVVVVNDGIRQEGQQWGDEHGIEIDENNIDKVEILKGPASLAYGSDAMAGVINMISAPTLPVGKIAGSLLMNYQTNNGLYGYSANLSGNQHGFIWDLRYSGKAAHAYQNKYDGPVFNSGFKENTLSGMLGLQKSWGYSHLNFSEYNFNPGIVEGDRDSLTGLFIKPIAENDTLESEAIATDEDFKSYTPIVPYQKVHHYKAVLNNSFILGNGSLKAILGFQQNRRQEYAEVLSPDDYGLYFFLSTYNYDIRYSLPERNNFNCSFGVNGMYQSSQNKGTEFLIPEYRLFDIGVFALVKKNFDRLDISGGLRYDHRNDKTEDLYLDEDGLPTTGEDSTAFQQFDSFHENYVGVSGSIGATYQFNDGFFTKLNIARGFRAPNISELSSNGVHEGTINYIIGVPTLKPETSLQFDYAIGINSAHVTADLDLFSNSINDFIFQEKLNSVNGGDSLTQGYSTFKYTSGQAHLWGGEISIDIHPHPLDWLHFENTFSYVRAIQPDQPDSTKYLPNIPAPKFTSELKATKLTIGHWLANGYIALGIESYFDQNNFYAAFGTETATPGYTLMNCELGADIVSGKKTKLSIYIIGNNLTDVAYQSHLSRLKYAPRNNVTGRTGVFNMGRNFSLKLIIPVSLSGQ